RIGTIGSGTFSPSGAVTVGATHIGNFSRTSTDADAAGGNVAVGADVAINVIVGWTTTAEITRNITAASVAITADSDINSAATSGDVRVSATDQTNTLANALGLALCDSGCDANVAAAVGLNVVDAKSVAEIGAGATVSGANITVEAITPGDARNYVIARGLAAAGGDSKVGVAGSIGVVAVDFETTAT